jgi:isoamylase
MNEITTARGRPLPLGTNTESNNVNFAVLSRHATSVTLVVHHAAGNGPPIGEWPLDPRLNRTGDHWHIAVGGLPMVFCYGWRVDGPRGPLQRFDPTRLLIDPCSTAISNGELWNGTCEVDPERTARRSLHRHINKYDWGDDAPLQTPEEDSVYYELHVRGFTIGTSSAVVAPGTFKGLTEKIPYLQWLGITAVELLPVFEFDECDCPFYNPTTGEKLTNFWGYNPIGFAAPKAAYAASAGSLGQDDEFRDMVKAFHKAGIEVILDVVFNHTGEGDDRGRTYHFRGYDNEMYYLLNPSGQYLNYSGCGNTVNCNHPVVRELILSSLRYWVTEMHVDGFRFDLASILGRDRRGRLMANPPAIEMIADDGILSNTKLIAEPWDSGGAYQMGAFPSGERWTEWNDRFRDDVRRFWRGDPGLAGSMASRICGSADIFRPSGRGPQHSLNFITCHDGFTLHDLVSYNEKHNEANGEQNRDGSGNNSSWNSGVEGDTADADILKLRQTRAKSMMVTLLLSQGIPMVLGGDEFLRTQQGNNNAWCQDSELSWVDWSKRDSNAGFHRFVRELIWLRRKHPVFRRKDYLQGNIGPHTADIRWHGQVPNEPDFSPQSHLVAYTLDGRFHHAGIDPKQMDADFYIAMNGGHEAIEVEVPMSPTGRRWFPLLNTAAASPEDFAAPEADGKSVEPSTVLTIEPFATVVLRSQT